MIFFTDMDGTLLSSQKVISERAFAALDAIAAAGHELVPCTGRAADRMDPALMEHPSVRHLVSANGASIYETHGRRLLRRICLGLDRALALYELRAGRNVTFDIFADGACYTERSSYERLEEFVEDPYIRRAMRQSRTTFDDEVPAFLRTLDQIERIAMYWNDPADRDFLVERIGRDPSVSCVRSYPMNIEVSDAAANKGSALTWLCEQLRIPVRDAIAFGDNINDISMIRAAGTGVAVANAEPEVIAAADQICRTNDEDGVARFIMEQL